MVRTTCVSMFLALIFSAMPAWAEDAPTSEQPPVVRYAGSRSSSDWVEMPGGMRVGVGKGAAWKGVKVYISMTWDLVGVDVATGKTLFGKNIGAFWNAFTFKQVTPKGGSKVWAIELMPGGRRADVQSMRQYHDLRTGEKLEVPGLTGAPAGSAFDIRVSWSGKTSDIAEKYRLLVTTEKNWLALRARMFPAVDPERFSVVDWENEVVFAISSGNSSNCAGYAYRASYEDETRVLLRIDRSSFQTMNGYEKTRPWGFFVLPRRAAKAYEVEIDSQGLIGGPPLWRSVYKTARLPRPETELQALPAKSTAAHEGWSQASQGPRVPPPPPPKRPQPPK